MPIQPLRIIDVTPGWAMGQFGSCLMVVWRAQPTPEAFRQRNRLLIELAKAEPSKSVLIEIVEETSKAPSDETRRVAMEVFKQLGHDLRAIGFVLEGTHVRSSLNRAVLTGMMFFVKQLQPTKIFKHTREVARWVRPYVGTNGSGFEGALVEALEALRQSIPHR